MSDGFFPDYIDEDLKEKNEDNEQDDFSVPVLLNNNDVEWSDEELEEASKENEVNQRHEEEFQEVMDNASRKLDGYWDRDNLIVRIIMYCLFGFAVFGVIYYIFLWIFSN